MFRELDQRQSDHMNVTLEWDPATGGVQVRCEDHRSPEHGFGERSASGAGREQIIRRKRRRRWFRPRTESEAAERSGDYSWVWWLPYGTSDPPAWL
jgi:ribosomal protein L34